jgi:hypothetical protein
MRQTLNSNTAITKKKNPYKINNDNKKTPKEIRKKILEIFFESGSYYVA